MNKLLCLAVVLLMLVSCGANPITGSWVQPIPGMENKLQGFRLDEGGKAFSINMHTLRYSAWKEEGNMLILEGESLGNGQTIKFKDEYRILKLNDRELSLGSGDAVLNYTRENG